MRKLILVAILAATFSPAAHAQRARAVLFDGGTAIAKPHIYDGTASLTKAGVISYWSTCDTLTLPAPGSADTIASSYPFDGSSQIGVAIRHYRNARNGNLVFNLFAQSFDKSKWAAIYSSTPLPCDNAPFHIVGAFDTVFQKILVFLNGTPIQLDGALTNGTGPLFFPMQGSGWIIGADVDSNTNLTDFHNGMLAELYAHFHDDDYQVISTVRYLQQPFAVSRNGVYGPMDLGPHCLNPLGIQGNIPTLCQRGDSTADPPPLGGFLYTAWDPASPFVPLAGTLQDDPISPWMLWGP